MRFSLPFACKIHPQILMVRKNRQSYGEAKSLTGWPVTRNSKEGMAEEVTQSAEGLLS